MQFFSKFLFEMSSGLFRDEIQIWVEIIIITKILNKNESPRGLPQNLHLFSNKTQCYKYSYRPFLLYFSKILYEYHTIHIMEGFLYYLVHTKNTHSCLSQWSAISIILLERYFIYTNPNGWRGGFGVFFFGRLNIYKKTQTNTFIKYIYIWKWLNPSAI